MPVLYTNNALSNLSASITNAATSLSVTAGTGNRFPNPGGSDHFYATLTDPSGEIEIVRVTSRMTDTMTVVRGQDGTTARAWGVGANFELRVNRAMLDDFKDDTRAGNAATATALQTARTIGGVSFNGTANINLPGVNTAGNQNTTGSAASLTTARAINGTNFNGTAAITTANWGTARTLSFTGDVTGSSSVNGSANVATAMTLANSGVTAGTYPKVTVDAKGRVTAGAALLASDVPTLNQNTTGNAATATTLQTARTINGVSFNGSANITLPTVNTSGNQTISGTKTFSTGVSISGTGGLNMNNRNITGINHMIIADPGVDEGLAWAGGNGWAVYESPDNLSNAAGNLQFVSGGPGTGATRRMTLNTSGVLWTSGGFSGNAATATTLATARTINGTSFNGSANITTANWGTARTINGSSVNGSANVTTANWGTARTLTIGSTGKSVNGSANVSWTLAEIGAAASSATVNLTGNQTVAGVKTFSNKLQLSSATTHGGTINMPRLGTANPGSTVDGDIWYRSNNIYYNNLGTVRAVAHTGSWSAMSVAEGQAGTATSSRFMRADRLGPIISAYAPTLTGSGASGTWGINITGSSASTTGNAATATTLATARTINGVSFNGSANITLPTVNTSGNQTISGTKTFSGSLRSTRVFDDGGTNRTGTSIWEGPPSSGANRTATFRMATLTGNRTYTFPNASGTVALTSGTVNLSGNQTVAGVKTFSGQILLGNAASLRQTTTTWTGNPGTGQGKLEYHSNRWYVVSGSDSTEVLRFRRSGTDIGHISNAGLLTMSSNIVSNSDERLKKDWSELPPDFIGRLAKVKVGTYTRIDSGERQAGSSAQDWQKLLPEVVNADNDERGTLSIAYGNAALVSAIELAKRVVALEKELRLMKESSSE